MKSPFATMLTMVVFAMLASSAPSRGASDNATPATGTAASATGKKYPINLKPAWKVGQKFTYLADAFIKVHATSFDPADPTAYRLDTTIDIESHIEGMAEVLATKNGALTKMGLTVTAMNATSGGRPVNNNPIGKMQRPTQILGPGAKVVVERDKDGLETFTVDDKPLIGEIIGNTTIPSMTIGANGRPTYHAAAYYLRMLIDLDDYAGTDQDIFGPKEAVVPGDSWPAKADALKKTLEAFNELAQYLDPPMAPDPQHRPLEFPATVVTMKFDNVTGSGNDQAAAVSGNFTINGMNLPPQPASTKIPNLAMDLQGELSLSCPVNTDTGVLTKTSTVSAKKYRASVQPPGAPNDTMDQSLEFKLSQQFTFP